jgi:hypothetical protein
MSTSGFLASYRSDPAPAGSGGIIEFEVLENGCQAMHATVCDPTLTVQSQLHNESCGLVGCVGCPATECVVRLQPGGHCGQVRKAG